MGWLQPVGNSTSPRPSQRGQWKFTMTANILVFDSKGGESKRTRERIDVLAKVLAKTANASIRETAEGRGDVK